MIQQINPTWWGPDNDFEWDHVKLTMKHEWERTRRATPANRPSNHKSSNIEASASQKPTFEQVEIACRFGYGSHLEYDADYGEWDDDLENELARDWHAMNPTRLEMWDQVRNAIRYGWTFTDENSPASMDVLTAESMRPAGCYSNSLNDFNSAFDLPAYGLALVSSDFTNYHPRREHSPQSVLL